MTTTTLDDAPITPAAARPAAIASTILWTAAGVGALVLLGKGINAAGTAAGLPYACWQLTGARAAAVAGTLGTLVALRRGHVALFGALYGGYLLATHASTATFSSAILAGAGAWLVAMLLSQRGVAVRLLASVATFNVLMTFGSMLNTMHGKTRGGWPDYTTGVGLRLLATGLICAAILGVIKLVRPSAR